MDYNWVNETSGYNGITPIWYEDPNEESALFRHTFTASENSITTFTNCPTFSPTSITLNPSNIPSTTPSNNPSIPPTINPTSITINPTINPTTKPINDPTFISTNPSNIPTVAPSNIDYVILEFFEAHFSANWLNLKIRQTNDVTIVKYVNNCNEIFHSHTLSLLGTNPICTVDLSTPAFLRVSMDFDATLFYDDQIILLGNTFRYYRRI